MNMSSRSLKTVRTWELHQIYNRGAVGDTNEQIRFRGQKVKGQGRHEINYRQKARGTFEVHTLNVKVTENISGEGIDGSPSRII